MATAEQEPRVYPPYVAYGTWKNFLESLKTTGIPSRIDKSVMSTLSGGTQSDLLSTLRFLNLIGPAGEPRDELERLANATGTDEWPNELRRVITANYAPVIGNLDLMTATSTLLMEQFRATGAEGATADKAVRFYLNALREAKIEFSSRLSTRKPRTGARRAQSNRSKQDRAPVTSSSAPPATPQTEIEEELPKGMIEFPVYFKGKPRGRIIVPESITVDDCKMFSLALQMVEAYAAQQSE